MNVAMYVFNDCRTDARVLREARALAEAGHRVTIVARHDDASTASREVRDGFEVVRVAVPTLPYGIWAFARYPWRLRRAAAEAFRAGRRRRLRGVHFFVLAAAILIAAGAWSLVRLPVLLLARAVQRMLRRRPTAGGDLLDWLARWQFRVMPWAQQAARIVPDADVHHAHDLSGLPAAIEAGRGRSRPVVYDSHEVFLESGSNAVRPNWVRKRFALREQAWIRETAGLVTVNDDVAAELRRRYEVPPITVVHNCPPRWTPPAIPEDRIRTAAGIPGDAVVALYHGAFSPHRGLEQLVLSILEPGMDDVHAVFLGYGSQRSMLEGMARDGRWRGRLHVLPAVAIDEVVPWVAGADVEVIAVEPSTLNHVLATPNKLFEALAAGVPAVVSDFPVMRRIVTGGPDGPLGATCDPTPESVARAIRLVVDRTPEERATLRARCLRAAHDRWNWETESTALLELYERLERRIVPVSAATV